MSKLTDELEALVKRYSWNEHQPFFDDGQAHAFGRALQLAREHEAATGWRPIAEAPKNGERHYVGQFAMVSGEWLRYSAAWSNGHWWQDGGRVYPTHYLPSPPPPEPKP